MFQKKNCKRCGKKISDKYHFCPYCGEETTGSSGDEWGMLGKEDDFFANERIKLPFGFNTLVNSLMKNLDKEFKKLDENSDNEFKQPIKRSGVSISISTSFDGKPKISFNSIGDDDKLNKKQQKEKKFISKSFSPEKLKKFQTLAREEPKTSIRRFSKKVVYEIEMEGVKTIEDISLTKLENSIEIRAIAKDKAYFKLLPINLPISNYTFSEEKLILELQD